MDAPYSLLEVEETLADADHWGDVLVERYDAPWVCTALQAIYRQRDKEEGMARQPVLPCPVCKIAIKGSWKVREHMLQEHRVRLWLRNGDQFVYVMKGVTRLHDELRWIEANFNLNAGVKQEGPWYVMPMAVWEQMYGNGWATQTRRKIERGEVPNELPTGQGEDYGLTDAPAPAPTDDLHDADLGGGLMGSLFADK